MKAKVFKQQNVAVLHRADFGIRFIANTVLGKCDTALFQQVCQMFGTGTRLYFSTRSPFGRPRCEARITRAPCSNAYWIVGSAARMRVSSSTLPSLMGTLKSTRMKTRLPFKSRSLIESLGIEIKMYSSTGY